jgi:cytochrome c-type biogenesis protein CcmH/NrfG
MLGELLVALGRPRDALAEYAISLKLSPNRLNGFLGAARAAVAAGDEPSARTHYESALALAKDADPLPELDEARSYVRRPEKERTGGR